MDIANAGATAGDNMLAPTYARWSASRLFVAVACALQRGNARVFNEGLRALSSGVTGLTMRPMEAPGARPHGGRAQQRRLLPPSAASVAADARLAAASAAAAAVPALADHVVGATPGQGFTVRMPVSGVARLARSHSQQLRVLLLEVADEEHKA